MFDGHIIPEDGCASIFIGKPAYLIQPGQLEFQRGFPAPTSCGMDFITTHMQIPAIRSGFHGIPIKIKLYFICFRIQWIEGPVARWIITQFLILIMF